MTRIAAAEKESSISTSHSGLQNCQVKNDLFIRSEENQALKGQYLFFNKQNINWKLVIWIDATTIARAYF